MKEAAYKARGFWKVVAILCLVALTGILSFELLCVNHLEVEGNQAVSAEAVKALSGIKPGMNMLKISFDEVAAALSRNPYIELRDIERQFPDTVILHVYERRERAVVEHLGAYVCIDEHGTILRTAAQPGAGSIRVTGMGLQGVKAGERIKCKVGQKPDSLCRILQFLVDGKRLDTVTGIDMRDVSDIKLTLKAGYAVLLGDAADIPEKFRWVDAMLPVLAEKGYDSGTLNVTSISGATYSP